MRFDVELAPLTTLRIGGACRALARVKDSAELEKALRWARSEGLAAFYLGEGSNVLFADEGFAGLVVRNEMRGVDIEGREAEVAGGENLPALIRLLNERGLAGMERMYGIPGTVAGAVVGNAGAYGQEICERVVEADVWEEGRVRTLDRRQLGFGYRHSRLKERRDWFLLRCRLRLRRSGGDLQKVSDEILRQREVKYPPELRCPGSFFKNLPAGEVPEEAAARMPESFLHYGKIPAGVLLEQVGAKGQRRGGARIADYHGNLFVNEEGASAEDMLALAEHFAGRVKERFGVGLEAEIRIVKRDDRGNVPVV